MSSIKPKTGSCSHGGCGYSGRLIGGKCQRHYWQGRASKSKTKPANVLKEAQKTERTKELDIWFLDQIQMIPNHCEECETNLGGWRQVMPKAIIAHILPKRVNHGFPDVATHPDNRMFLCPDCHTNLDNKGSDFALNMKSLNLMRSRYKQIEPFLSESDVSRVPDYLKDGK